MGTGRVMVAVSYGFRRLSSTRDSVGLFKLEEQIVKQEITYVQFIAPHALPTSHTLVIRLVRKKKVATNQTRETLRCGPLQKGAPLV